jgi:hypothetical protein
LGIPGGFTADQAAESAIEIPHTSILFSCDDSQPDFVVLQIPTIILAHTALLPCEIMPVSTFYMLRLRQTFSNKLKTVAKNELA